MRKIGLLVITLAGCGPAPGAPTWSDSVHQHRDNLTGEPTGHYETTGPTVKVVVHGRETDVSFGYFCTQRGDGLVVQMSVPLDSVRLRNLFAASATGVRMAVDRAPVGWSFSAYLTDSTAAVLAAPNLADVPRPRASDIMDLGRSAYIGWGAYEDDVLTVALADSVAFDLGDIGSTVVRYSTDGMADAIKAARFWCPIETLLDSLNTARTNLLAFADSIRDARVARENAARQAAQQRRERAAVEQAARLDRAREVFSACVRKAISSLQVNRCYRETSGVLSLEDMNALSALKRQEINAAEARRNAAEARRIQDERRTRLAAEAAWKASLDSLLSATGGVPEAVLASIRFFAERNGGWEPSAAGVIRACHEILRRANTRGDPRLQRTAPAPAVEPCRRIIN